MNIAALTPTRSAWFAVGNLRIVNATLPGDFTDNNVADYVTWRKGLGQTGTGLAADGNGNGAIDNGDYNVWRAHFGQTGSGSSTVANAAVPEPSTLALLIVGILVMGSG